MRLSHLFGALLMLLVQATVAAAQPATGTVVDRRWGLLGELAEQDLVSYYAGKPSMPATVRWEVPNQVLVFTDWGPVQRAEHKFTLDLTTGKISVQGFSRASPTAEAADSGEVFWIMGERREPFLSRSGDGGIHALWTPNKLDYFPIGRAPQMQARLAKLVTAGKVRAAAVVAPSIPRVAAATDPRWGLVGEMAERDFSVNYGLASAPATVRWEVPGKSVLITDWGGLGRAEKRLTLDEQSGGISVEWSGTKFGVVQSRPGGELHWISGSASGPFLTRTADGAYRQRWASSAKHSYTPIDPASAGGAKLRRLVSEGRVRAADPTISARMATAPTMLPPSQQVAPQTFVSTTAVDHDSPPATSVAPAVAAAAAVSGPRYALIIGNSQYQSSLGRLPNPVNDAQSVASALRAVGFDVDLITDADQKGMKRAISRFGERLSTARGATGLFYYAGHGIQSRGTNYLIPVSAPIEREADLDLEAVAADTVLAQMEDAGAATSIVILDACRNMPLARSFRSASRGLARMDAPNGSFVAYSTAPGAVAADGDGRNSPFALALVKQLGQKGTPIEVIFRGVRREVVEATGGQQTPWDSSSLLDPFYFVP